MRFFLATKPDGALLPLRCSEAEFSAHAGSGASIYMHFVKMTGWLFMIASIIAAIPQFVANFAGHGLHLNLPWSSAPCQTAFSHDAGLIPSLIDYTTSTLAFFLYSQMLG